MSAEGGRPLTEEERETFAEALRMARGEMPREMARAEGLTRTERKLAQKAHEERTHLQATWQGLRRAAKGAGKLAPGSVVMRVVRGIQFRLMLDTEGRAHLLRPGTRPTLAELDAREGRGAVKL